VTKKHDYQFAKGRPIDARLKTQTTLYHSDEWLSALCRFYGYDSATTVIEQAGQVRAFAPLVRVSNFSGRKLCSPPASMYGHLVASTPEDIKALVDQLRSQARVERRRLIIKTRDASLEGLHIISHEYDCRVAVTTPDENWAKLDGAARRAVKKSRKDGVIVREASFQELDRFLPLLATTRRRLGLPMAPRAWLKTLFVNGFARLLLAEHGGKVCAGVLFTQDPNHLHYALPAYSDEGALFRAMDAVIWRLLELAWAENRQFLCFGGSPEQNEGLRRFKRKWGGEECIVTLWSDQFPKSSTQVVNRPEGLKRLVRWFPQWGLEALGYVYLRYFQ
jgi:hypothetical protein